jgi:hypothetical protein
LTLLADETQNGSNFMVSHRENFRGTSRHNPDGGKQKRFRLGSGAGKQPVQKRRGLVADASTR